MTLKQFEMANSEFKSGDSKALWINSTHVHVQGNAESIDETLILWKLNILTVNNSNVWISVTVGVSNIDKILSFLSTLTPKQESSMNECQS